MRKTLKYVFAVLAVTGLVANAELINLTDPSLEAGFGGTSGTAESGWFSFGGASAAQYASGPFWNIANTDGANAAYAVQTGENAGGNIYQTVQLDAGVTYRLTAGIAQSASVPKSDGEFALVFYNSNFSFLAAETTGTVGMTGSFTDYSVDFSPLNTGIFNVGLQNRGYVPGTGGDNNESTIWIDNVRLEVVPEPATLGLVAVFGGAVLFIRRRLMI